VDSSNIASLIILPLLFKTILTIFYVLSHLPVLPSFTISPVYRLTLAYLMVLSRVEDWDPF